MLLSARDAARLLRTSERQIYLWVDAEEIPFQRIREQVRFNRTELLEWATVRRLPIALEAFDGGDDPEERAPSLADAIRVGGVHHDVPAAARDEALTAVVERTPMPADLDRELLTEMLIVREAASSTAIGEGIAIPHGKLDAVGKLVACVGRARQGVDFDSIDGQPTHIFFVLVAPENSTGIHLKALARISRLFKDPEFRQRLLAAADAHEMYTTIAEEDAKY